MQAALEYIYTLWLATSSAFMEGFTQTPLASINWQKSLNEILNPAETPMEAHQTTVAAHAFCKNPHQNPFCQAFQQAYYYSHVK